MRATETSEKTLDRSRNQSKAMIEFEEEHFDVKEYWRILLNYKWMILGIVVSVGVLAEVVVFFATPIYRSTATLIVESQQTKAVETADVVSDDKTQEQYYSTNFELLKSRDLALKVIDQLQLDKSPEFNSEVAAKLKPKKASWIKDLKNSIKQVKAVVLSWLPKSENEKTKEPLTDAQLKEAIVSDFISRLTVTPRLKTQLVDISFDAKDPKLAQQLTEALGAAFIESSLDARLDATRKVADWLSTRLKSLKDKLDASERELQAYLKQENLVDVEGVLTVTSREIENNSSRLADAQRSRIEAENIYNQVKALGNNIYSNTEVVPAILEDSGIRDLKQREAEVSRKISELTDRYGTEHPSMLSARAELESIHKLLRKQISGVVSGIKNRYEVARSNEQAVLNALDRSKAQAQEIGRKEAKLRELKGNVESNRHLYEMFFNRSKEASEQAELRAPNIRFIDHASEPRDPVKPKKGLIVGASIFASLIAGILLAFVRNRLDSSLRTAKDIEEKIGAPLLGIVPLYKHKKTQGSESFVVGTVASAEPKSAFAEAIRTVRTRLFLSAAEKSQNVWLVTSSVAKEGKTSFAMNLAMSMARMDGAKVILIDADMRRPSLMENFRLPRRTPGLSHYLTRTADLESCIQSISIQNGHLDVISAGIIPPNPLELLSSPAFSDLLEKLERLYSVVLIDSPPIHSVSDAHLLAQHVGAVIYIVKADSTPVTVVQDGLKHLQHFNVPLSGIVLNQVDMDKLDSSNKYYNSYYYKSPYEDNSHMGDAA